MERCRDKWDGQQIRQFANPGIRDDVVAAFRALRHFDQHRPHAHPLRSRDVGPQPVADVDRLLWRHAQRFYTSASS